MSKAVDKIRRIRDVVSEGEFCSTVYAYSKPYFKGLKYSIYNPSKRRVEIIRPEFVTPSRDESPLVERIFKSYVRMKNDQKEIRDSAFAPSEIWQNHIDRDYRDLVAAYEQEDVKRFHYFVCNFGSLEVNTGIENSNWVSKEASASRLKKRYLENDIYLKGFETWQWFYRGYGRKVSDLSYPRHGNQAGASIDGHFVGVGSFFNEIYGSLLANLISSKEKPIVAELGAGYGKLAYFTLRDIPSFSYIDFDLPEVLCVAAYYLMKTWPDKSVLLYGEKGYSGDRHEEHDLIFMPNFEISKIRNSSVDLFVNKNSMGEMTRASVERYLTYICKATHHFFHLNHEFRRRLGQDSMLAYEFPIPKDKFRLVSRYPDFGHILIAGKLDFDIDIFLYLYERIQEPK